MCVFLPKPIGSPSLAEYLVLMPAQYKLHMQLDAFSKAA